MAVNEGVGPVEHPATDRLIYIVNRLARALNRAADDVAQRNGLSLSEFLLLLVLGEGPGLSNAQLARRTFVSSQAAHSVVTELEARGMLSKAPHETNRRVILARITPQGRAVLDACLSEIIKTESTLLDALSPAERTNLLPALLHSAETLAGGWFGDEAAEQAAAARRARTN
ncbi:MAG: MarR family transcriptional regulator [Actinomycetota bacterium]|nr:MarR family transcriptional regulator [Actinomycetota bacterium]